MINSRQDVQNTSIWFLEDGLYEKVKPYTLAFQPDVDIPRHNIKRKEVSRTILDLRGSEHEFTLDRNGFMVLNFQEVLTPIDWDNKATVKQIHYPRVVAEIECTLPGVRCLPLRHQLRKRHASFPESTGEDYDYGQPLLAAHVDMVHSSAEQLVRECLSEKEADSVLKNRYMIVNVWHPLKGPNQDWPLALCDSASLDPERDLEVADYITETASREHCFLYARDSHRWWYLSNQETTEAFIFRQYDSEKGILSGIPHAAFPNPHSLGNEPRESIEVVIAVYWPRT